ncbi:MAG: hypothetical protein IJH67_08150 [Thermoguttaceae bacterium]|nr:hypothetical protein [Thermoguttaceae bacterium]
MNSKQYDECLLAVLTYCESLEQPKHYSLNQENLFGMSQNELVSMVSDLKRNNYIKAEICAGTIIFMSLTLEGREKLEQLRDKLWNRRWYVRTWRWICDIWWIHVPVLIATIHYFLELLNSLFKFLHLLFS